MKVLENLYLEFQALGEIVYESFTSCWPSNEQITSSSDLFQPGRLIALRQSPRKSMAIAFSCRSRFVRFRRLMRRFLWICRSSCSWSEAWAWKETLVRRLRGTTWRTYYWRRAEALSQHGCEEPEESGVVYDHGVPCTEDWGRVSVFLYLNHVS